MHGMREWTTVYGECYSITYLYTVFGFLNGKREIFPWLKILQNDLHLLLRTYISDGCLVIPRYRIIIDESK